MLYNGAAGYQTDSATGLQLLGHRYYDPSIGRFLSSDPAQAGTNWYAYCDNNPLVGCDPTGLIKLGPVNLTWGEIGGAVGGAIVGGIVLIAAPEIIVGAVAIGTFVGTVGGDHYGDHQGWIPSLKDGIVQGALSYAGGKLLSGVAKIVKPFLPDPPIAPPKNLWDWGKFYRWLE